MLELKMEKTKCSNCERRAIAWLGNPVKPYCAYCWNIIKKNKKELENKNEKTRKMHIMWKENENTNVSSLCLQTM